MLSIRNASLVLATLTVAACGDHASAPMSAPHDIGGASYDVTKGSTMSPNNQHITGHAAFIVADEGNIAEAYSVDAKAVPTAPATPSFTFAKGELEYGSAEGPDGFHIHGEMYCFKVEGDRANLAARVTQSSNPNVHVGDYLTWRIQDSDEKHGNPPDMTTQLFLSDQVLATSFCQFGGDPTHPFFPTKGNLEIHDQ